MKSYENYARLLGENLNHQVFQNFMLPLRLRNKEISLREKEQYEWMDRIVRNTIHSFKIDLVNIYDIGQGVVAYSTDSRLIGKPVKESLGYRRAINGENYSGLISERDYIWGVGIEKIGGEKKLRTYIPFTGMGPFSRHGYVGGVFELIQDLTTEYQAIVKLQYLIFASSILIMGLIFLALLLIVRKAEKNIEAHVSEQRELEAQLNQAERLASLGEMVAGVSHEIRNPLGIIRSTVEHLSGMPEASQAQRKLLGVIIEESGRLDGIVTEFLDFARPQTPNFEQCYLDEIIRKNLLFLHPELDKEKIFVNDNLDGRSLTIKADPQLLYRGFLNIFVNAIQSMKNGGRMNVHVTEENGHYVVAIEDTGGGISKKNISKIFNPFFSTKEKGSGLGLSIVKNIIEGHDGSISIESEEGSGTKVIIRLPMG